MVRRGHPWRAAVVACTLLLLGTSPSYPSEKSDAGRTYRVACQRLAELKKSDKRKKYRSYWMDCARTLEAVERKYPASPAAADACFERANLYADLYQITRIKKDIADSQRLFSQCQAAYPKHLKAPEALYRVVGSSLDYTSDTPTAMAAYEKLAAQYPQSAWTGKAKKRLGLAGRDKKQEQVIRAQPKKETLPVSTVKEIRHWSSGAYTRIVIDLDQPFAFETSELKNPDRLVFDLSKSHVADSLNKDPLPINDGILRQVRASQYAPDTVRVVLDLASLKSYAAFPLHDPNRLVIDVTGDSGEPAASAKQEEPKVGAAPAGGNGVPARNGNGSARTGDRLSLSRQLGLKVKTIAIDAGHGGHDPGALGRNGLREKEVTLDIAKRLAVLVKERLGCTVIMTRDRDVFVPLDKRPFLAKSGGADLFVSIHANANRKRAARGIETYIQSLRATDTDAMATAARENAMSTKKLSELKSELEKILKDLAGDDKSEESLHLAHAVQGSLVENAKPAHRSVMNLGVKRAFFYVLINTEMPSILAEVGFISNADEEKLLRTASYRQKIAEALFQGIKKYVEARNPQVAGI